MLIMIVDKKIPGSGPADQRIIVLSDNQNLAADRQTDTDHFLLVNVLNQSPFGIDAADQMMIDVPYRFHSAAVHFPSSPSVN